MTDRRRLTTSAPFLFALLSAMVGATLPAAPARAQSLLSITTPVSGHTVDGTLSFAGSAAVNTFTRQGTIRGSTNKGASCSGSLSLNLTFSSGSGRMRCGALDARFSFTLTTLQPPSGNGTGVLSDGRKVTLTIGR